MKVSPVVFSVTLVLGVMIGALLTWLGLSTDRRKPDDAPQAVKGSAMRTYAIRLTPGEDLKAALLAYARKESLRAPVILTCVGSLTDVNLRFANQPDGTTRTGHFEILSLVGLLDAAGGHLHLCVADRDGVTFGGHVLEGCRVYTTAEVVIGELTDLAFDREEDKTFGYNELVIHPRERR